MSGGLKPVFVTNQWSLEGGYLGRPVFLDTRDVDIVSGISAFVKIDKNVEWLLKAVIGKTGFKGGLNRSTLFDTLNTKLEEIAAASPQLRESFEEDLGSVKRESLEGSPNSEVTEPATSDPMSQLEDIGSTTAMTPKKRNVYISKRGKNNITEVEMTEFEPTSHPNQGGWGGRSHCLP